MKFFNVDVICCCLCMLYPSFCKFYAIYSGFSLHHLLFLFCFGFFSCLPCNPVARRDHEPLYQFWLWYLGVISHVGHQLAKKRGPLWDAHLFSALGRGRSQRAAGMKGRVWEGPAEKTRVGGSIRTQSVCGTPAVYSYSNAACMTPLLAYNSEIRDWQMHQGKQNRMSDTIYPFMHAVSASPPPPRSLSVKLFG